MTNTTTPSGTSTRGEAHALLDVWLRLWNGDLTLAPDAVTPDFRLHAALLDGGDGSAVRGADGLAAWIGQTRAAFPDLHFAIEVAPLVDGAFTSVRWTAGGTYAGGFPGAEAAPGTVVAFTGTDTLRTHDGRYAEYWVNSDMLHLFAQLGVR
ncbi:ester cyclase [Streptomyces sp. NPDC006173]|uniref:ester cyclase n=1 Tax=Streptomyces sp. NPDC006173 TaxID=3155349 RepID=UPI0033CB040B